MIELNFDYDYISGYIYFDLKLVYFLKIKRVC